MLAQGYTPEQNILEASVDADGIVLLTISGRITNAHMDAVLEWIEKVKLTLQTAADTKVEPILVVCDVSGVTHFETKPVAALRDLLSYDKKFPLVTAVVGPNNMIQMLVDALISLTRRTNIKQFPAKKEALDWLLSNRHTTTPK